MKNAIATFTNLETGMESYVVPGQGGRYNVTLRDLDSGEFVPLALCGFISLAYAKVKAAKAADVPLPPAPEAETAMLVDLMMTRSERERGDA